MAADTIAIIPARYGSSRFPGKLLADIAGKSMIRRVYERTREAEGLDEVIVATDDKRIYDHIRSFQGNVVMTSARPRNGTERCAEVLALMAARPQRILCVQGDEPFIASVHFSLILETLQRPGTRIATLVKEIASREELFNPNVCKAVINLQGEAIYFSRSAIPHVRGRDEGQWLSNGRFFKHIGMYGYLSDTLEELVRLATSPLEEAEQLEQLRWLEHGYPIRVSITDLENFAVDTPEDLLRIQEKMGKNLF
jgi:3-deoxy-manno-octulosonate cytidylyltransferase (CMP-KDO synthetase)